MFSKQIIFCRIPIIPLLLHNIRITTMQIQPLILINIINYIQKMGFLALQVLYLIYLYVYKYLYLKYSNPLTVLPIKYESMFLLSQNAQHLQTRVKGLVALLKDQCPRFFLSFAKCSDVREKTQTDFYKQETLYSWMYRVYLREIY